MEDQTIGGYIDTVCVVARNEVREKLICQQEAIVMGDLIPGGFEVVIIAVNTIQQIQFVPVRCPEFFDKGIGDIAGFSCHGEHMHLALLVQILVIKLECQGINRVVMDVQIELKTTTNDEDNVGSKLFLQSLQIALGSNGEGVINPGLQGLAGSDEGLLLFFVVRIHLSQDILNLSYDGLGVDQLINKRMYRIHKIISFQSAAFQRGQLRNSLCRMLSKPTMRIIARICATDNALVL